MTLSIVKPDGIIVEVLMSEQQPSLEALNNELLFFENYHYKLIIHDSENYDSVELFVGDYAIPVYYNSSIDCFETELDLIFGGCFDLACISAYTDNGEGEGKSFFTDFLRIATTKQTAKQVEEMLEEIEENLPNFLEICFSRSKKRSGLIKNDARSIWNTLKIVDEIIKIYEESYGYFFNHKKVSVESVVSIVDVKAMQVIDQESLRWIACNPDYFVQTEKNTGIVINEGNYIPSKVKTYSSQYCGDVYENRIVLGFLKNVVDYLENQIFGFNKKIIELADIPESIVAQLPNTHEITGRCVYIYYKGIIQRFSEKKSVLQEMYYRYGKVFGCPAELVYGIPQFTNSFKQIYHYRLCYECMVKWFEHGDYSFDHLNYLFQLKTLSRIFEYFCLIKLQRAILLCGYAFREAKRIMYDPEDASEDINNQYIFEGNGYELTLLYEPSIWVNRINDGINLYSTGYNFSKCKWNDRWTPDFIIKICSNGKDYYYILDAKYSSAANVKKRYIPELVLKYGTQIASKDKFFSDIIGVGAIYPGSEDKIYFFKKNAVGSKKESLPKYFSLAIVGKNSGNDFLKERIRNLFEVVEKIEEEKEDINIPQEAIFQVDSSINNIMQQGDMLSIPAHDECEEKEMLKVQSTEILNTKDKQPLVASSGKKCFYFGKGLCLYKKTQCTIFDMTCEYYLPKNAKVLLTKESSCRNLISYTRRGKIQRVECSISGLPGCIGSEECKFCLKKNKRKQ